MESREKPKAELRNWEYSPYSKNAYVGDVYGHPHFEDGTRVRTSRVMHMKHAEQEIETLNTIYTLGERKHDASNST